MVGTSPTFYKIYVTDDLEFSVRHGRWPASDTRVFMHRPAVPNSNRRWNEGMKPAAARMQISKCCEAFKAIVSI